MWRTDAGPFDLALRGLLVSDEPEPELEELRSRDDTLRRTWWLPYAALYQLVTRWHGVRANIDRSTGAAAARVARLGAPPPPFHVRDDALATHELPLPSRDGSLFRLLDERMTSRTFGPGALTQDELSILLRTVWGARGYSRITDGLTTIRRTSPSGGALHPIEVYPLVARADGVEPGLYHYRARDHALDLLEPLAESEARELLERFTSGQDFYAGAAAGFLMVARYARTFWKYPRHDKALRIVYMDAGHLSQTFYLVCGELGLAPFVVGALNEVDVEERLRLDPYEHGVVAMCGCGRTPEGGIVDDQRSRPYVPRETEL